MRVDAPGERRSAVGNKTSQAADDSRAAQQPVGGGFLTMDFRRVRASHEDQGHKAIKALSTRVMSPEEFGTVFDLLPIAPRLFSYHDASYPVLSGERAPSAKKVSPFGTRFPNVVARIW